MSLTGTLLMRIVLLFAITLGINILFSCKQATPNDDLKKNKDNKSALGKPTSKIEVNLKEILSKKNDSDALVVSIDYDQYFKKPKKYKGFYLNTIIDSITKVNNFDTSNCVIIFKCVDGYKPLMNFSKLYRSSTPYIVYRDLSQNAINKWDETIKSKFEPYYLVWDKVSKEDNSYAWPCGLIGFQIISINDSYRYIYPYTDPSLAGGFTLFRDNCLKFHSINKIGGSIGPELNIPKNIMEYWTEKDIVNFIKDPASYRYNSRMPAITNVSDKEFTQILKYLNYMKNNKKISDIP